MGLNLPQNYEVMKKTISVFALAALFVSCSKEAEQTPGASGDVITVAPTEFSATLETPESDTKTTLGGINGKQVLWEEGDAISVWPGVFAQAKYTLSAGAGTTSATFSLSSEPATGDEIDGNVALYPYDGDVILTKGKSGLAVFKNIKYPAVQNYRENSWDKGAMPMFALSPLSANGLSFQNLAGVLRLTLKGTATIDSIRVSALGADEYIAGVFEIDLGKGTAFTSGEKTVTLKCGESGVALSEAGTVFNIVIPPITGGFKVAICDSEHGVMILHSSSEIKRNTILNMPAVNYAPNAMDLGLSVYWATCNVGATTPEGYGDYFAWGETETYYESGHAYDNPCYAAAWKEGKSNGYSLGSYTFYNDSSPVFTKYNATDGKTVLEADDDAASAKWGAAWRMPTESEMTELENNCTWTWTTTNGVSGCNVVSNKAGYTDVAIFLPAAGYRNADSLYDFGGSGMYWSSNSGGFSDKARYLSFDDYFGDDMYEINREYGLSVRPVAE